MMNVSPNGVSFIAGWEKYAATPYRDLNGFWTWGYGHLQMPGETRPAFISQPDAQALLQKDLGQFVGIANNALKVAVSQNQFDAFISILMNVERYAVHPAERHQCPPVPRRSPAVSAVGSGRRQEGAGAVEPPTGRE
jgi:GH24 family phage-related lysozyme (muramidase)